jgi:hypothetical protein
MKAYPAIGAAVVVTVAVGVLAYNDPWTSGRREPPKIDSNLAGGMISEEAVPELAVPFGINEDSPDQDSNELIHGSLELSQQLLAKLTALHEEEEEDRRELLLTHTVAWIERRGLAAVLDLLYRTGALAELQEVQQRLIQRLAKRNPKLAASIAFNRGGPEQGEWIDTVMIAWAERDINDAVGWLESLPPSDVRYRGQLSVAREATRTQPETAIRVASRLPPSPERDALLEQAASEWATAAPEVTLIWLSELDDDPLKERLIGSIAATLSEGDSIGAAGMALDAITEGKLQQDVVVAVVQRWTQRDPVAAAEWVSQFPEDSLRAAAIANVVKLWSLQGHQAPAQWLGTLPPGPSRDEGLRAYAEQITPTFPSEAARWASAIAAQSMRTAQLERTLTAWMEMDSAAARHWIKTANLPAQLRERLSSGN